MTTIYWVSQSVIYVHRLLREKVTELYQIIGLIRRQITETQPFIAKKKMLFHRKNPPTHTPTIAPAKLM